MENREIDEAVATRVMGWKLADRKKNGWGDGPPVWDTGDYENPTYQGFSPSADISAAWTVIEKMGPRCSVEQDLGSAWFVRFSRNGQVQGQSYGKTAPEAICLAALAAVEGK